RARALPVILHIVGAHGLALSQLEQHGRFESGGVVHSYSGSAELVARYRKLGLSISIGPSILRAGARRVIDAARVIDADALLVETDSPDQEPEPAGLGQVIEAVARARSESAESVAEISAINAARLFDR